LSNEFNAVVVQRIEVSPGLVILRIVPEGWELPDFEPGQFAVLGLPGSAPRTAVSDPEDEPGDPDKLLKRAYSIASSSKAKEYMEFYVSLVPSGELTPRLFELWSGDRVWLSPRAHGLFTLNDVEDGRHVAFIATGTGLAPYMSMLRTRLICGTGTHFAVLHGARHSWDLGYRSELMTVRQICSNFTYLPTISRPEEEPAEWAGHRGYLQDLWRSRTLADHWGFEPSPETTDIFICGNPAMIDEMVAILGEEGYLEPGRRRQGQLHVERYW
jgi:ferredoxin--NADP+ reductase